MPSLSLIIPAYNEEKNLPKVFQSLRGFTTWPDEIIFVNNNSTDRTGEIIDHETKNLNIPCQLLFETKQGIPYARNCGIRSASGEVVVFLDSDCQAPRDYIEKIKEHFAQNESIQAVSGQYALQGKDKTKANYRQATWSHHFGWDQGRHTVSRLVNQNGTIVSGCSAYRRETLLALGLFDERFIYMDDVAFSFKFYQNHGCCLFDPSIVVKHHIDTTEATIRRKDFRYGHDQALINRLIKKRKWEINSSQYRLMLNLVRSLASNQKELYFYQLRTLIYFKLGTFVKGLTLGCLYL